MMNTFLLCISCTNDMSHPPAVRLTIGCLEITETGQEKSSTICPNKTGQHCTTFEYDILRRRFIVELSETCTNDAAATGFPALRPGNLSFQAHEDSAEYH